jgi:hypothetical protein
MPGIEERIIYQVESTVWGTRISYSVTLRGWLSPVIWSFIRPYTAKVAEALAKAAEKAALQGDPGKKTQPGNSVDFGF